MTEMTNDPVCPAASIENGLCLAISEGIEPPRGFHSRLYGPNGCFSFALRISFSSAAILPKKSLDLGIGESE